MKNESADYQRGYAAAVAVHGTAHQPGFFKDREEADRVTRAMWVDGLNEAEAKAQQSNFLVSDRNKQEKISGALQTASTGGNGRIIRPSAEEEGFEPIGEVYGRREREMSAFLSKVEESGGQGRLAEQGR